MYLVGWLCFPIMEKWPYAGHVLWVLAAHSPVVTRATCFRGALLCGLLGTFYCGRLTTVGMLVGVAGHHSSWL